MKKVVILASGSGTIAQAIIDARDEIGIDIISLISDRPEAKVLERAKIAGIETEIHQMVPDRLQWNLKLLKSLENLEPDLIISAGFMRILSSEIVQRFKVINSHPALLPLYPGAHAVRDALAQGATVTGTTIHWVDQGVDTGEVIAQEEVNIVAGDSEESLHERIKMVERRLYVDVLRKIVPNLETMR